MIKTAFYIITALAMTNFLGSYMIDIKYKALLTFSTLLLSFGSPSKFRFPILLLAMALVINSITCYYFRQQAISETLRGSSQYLFIMYYFVLLKMNDDIEDIERITIAISLILCACYFLQYIAYPKVIFDGASREYVDDIRIRLAGQSFASLGFFLGLSRVLEGRKNLVYYTLVISGAAVIFLMGFRTMIVSTLIFSAFLAFKLTKKLHHMGLIAVAVMLFGLIFSQTAIGSAKIESMIERQQTDNFSNPEYVRILQFEYFTTDHFQSNLEMFLGSGYPSISNGIGQSNYGKYMQSLVDEGINWVDFGLVSLSWIIGIPAIIAMLLYAVIAAKTTVPKEYLYLRVWFVYLLSISLTTLEYARFGNFIAQAFALYMIEKAHAKVSAKQGHFS